MQKGFSLIIIILGTLLVLWLLSGGGYYLYNQQKLRSITDFESCAKYYPVMLSYPGQCNTPDGRHFVNELSDEERENLAPSPATQKSPKMEYLTSKMCNIKLLAPKEDESFVYPDGYWDFMDENSQFLNMNQYTGVGFVRPNSGTDADYGSVKIFCADNYKGFDNQALFNDLESNIVSYGKDQTTGDSVKIAKLGEVTKWEKPVYKINLEKVVYLSGDYYLLATDKKIYLIKDLVFPNSSNKTLETILNSIEFLE